MIVDTGLSLLYTTFGDVEEDSVPPAHVSACPRVHGGSDLSVLCLMRSFGSLSSDRAAADTDSAPPRARTPYS